MPNYIRITEQSQLQSVSQTIHKISEELLTILCRYRNNVVDREQILNTVWNNDSYYSARSMDVYVSKLRKYLKDDPTISIVNVHGKGYKLLIDT